MSRLRRIDIIEPCPSFFVRETSIFAPKTLAFPSFVEEEFDSSYALDLLNPSPIPSPFDVFDSFADLTLIDTSPFCSSYKRIQHRVDRFGLGSELSLHTLCDRVSALESRFDGLVNEKEKKLDRKYTWTAEIKDGVDRKYTWTKEIKGEKSKEKKEVKGAVKNYKWTAEIKKKNEEDVPIYRTYTFKASTGDAGDSSESEKDEKKKKKTKKGKKGKKCEKDERTVEIEEVADHTSLVLRHVS